MYRLPKNCIYEIIKNLSFCDYLNMRIIPCLYKKVISKEITSLILKERYGITEDVDIIDIEKQFKDMSYSYNLRETCGNKWSINRIEEIKKERKKVLVLDLPKMILINIMISVSSQKIFVSLIQGCQNI